MIRKEGPDTSLQYQECQRPQHHEARCTCCQTRWEKFWYASLLARAEWSVLQAQSLHGIKQQTVMLYTYFNSQCPMPFGLGHYQADIITCIRYYFDCVRGPNIFIFYIFTLVYVRIYFTLIAQGHWGETWPAHKNEICWSQELVNILEGKTSHLANVDIGTCGHGGRQAAKGSMSLPYRPWSCGPRMFAKQQQPRHLWSRASQF